MPDKPNTPYGTYGLAEIVSELLVNLTRPPDKPRPPKQDKPKGKQT